MARDDFEIILPLEHRYEKRLLPGHTASQWKFRLREYHHRCAYCGTHQRATPEKHLFREHVIPVTQQGMDDITNVVPACRRCNILKSCCRPGQLAAHGRIVPSPKIFTRTRREKGWP